MPSTTTPPRPETGAGAAKTATGPVHGEVVEFFGLQYDVWGTAVGTQWESWSAKRLPKRLDATATHTNSGESVLTREDAVAWCMKEAWHRHIAITVHARHPALYGPHHHREADYTDVRSRPRL
ncbi:hypothetical protein [Streptomyces sp. NPDC049555]|uniref:hypothetical protein n=1 Tax=Streptomyces sp. NPDC049555 TaxID=3154930 RepID=UPI003412FDF2